MSVAQICLTVKSFDAVAVPVIVVPSPVADAVNVHAPVGSPVPKSNLPVYTYTPALGFVCVSVRVADDWPLGVMVPDTFVLSATLDEKLKVAVVLAPLSTTTGSGLTETFSTLAASAA